MPEMELMLYLISVLWQKKKIYIYIYNRKKIDIKERKKYFSWGEKQRKFNKLTRFLYF